MVGFCALKELPEQIAYPVALVMEQLESVVGGLVEGEGRAVSGLGIQDKEGMKKGREEGRLFFNMPLCCCLSQLSPWRSESSAG